MASDERDPQSGSVSSSESESRYSLERRKFLALLGAAGTYAAPVIAGLVGTSRSAEAQTSPSTATGTSTYYSSSSPGTSSSSYYSSSSLSSGASSSYYVPQPVIIHASADAFLRRESENTNEGGNPLLRVGVGPLTRAVVLFDRTSVLNALPGATSVQLALRIAFNGNNWGQQDNRTVDVYPLLEDFVEGNGRQSGMPGSLAVRGTGAGVTWMSPSDPNVSDNTPHGATSRWRGGNRVGAKTASGVVHLNQVVEVDVTWDVKQDILAGYPVVGWVIKVTDEGDEGDWDAWDGDHRHGRHHDDDDRHDRGEDRGEHRAAVPTGDDRGYGGTVSYYSREGAGNVGNADYGPRLIVNYV
ncbi:MAG: hypothetical protein KGN76_01755 [Acidobacteriota bacterium]|nr:hypothetical protein [Acidobacteriota bacterium]